MNKEKRDISGVFFRYQNCETKKWENWCFEDLPLEKQMEIMGGKTKEWVENLCVIMADNLNAICHQFDITANPTQNIENKHELE